MAEVLNENNVLVASSDNTHQCELESGVFIVVIQSPLVLIYNDMGPSLIKTLGVPRLGLGN